MLRLPKLSRARFPTGVTTNSFPICQHGFKYASTMSAIKRGIGRSDGPPRARINDRKSDGRTSEYSRVSSSYDNGSQNSSRGSSNYGRGSSSSGRGDSSSYGRRGQGSLGRGGSSSYGRGSTNTGRGTSRYDSGRGDSRPSFSNRNSLHGPFGDYIGRSKYNDGQQTGLDRGPRSNVQEDSVTDSENRPRASFRGDSDSFGRGGRSSRGSRGGSSFQDRHRPRFGQENSGRDAESSYSDRNPRSYDKDRSYDKPAYNTRDNGYQKPDSYRSRGMRGGFSSPRGNHGSDATTRLPVYGEDGSVAGSKPVSWTASEDSSTRGARFDPKRNKDYVSIERTTAASEYIYGRSSSLAALKAGRRQMYKLYLARSPEDEKTGSEDLYKSALDSGTEVIWITNQANIFEMDKLAKGRPHNGVILEASPLPKLPISALGSVQKGQPFNVQLRHQSKEDELVNGTDTEIPFEAKTARYPLVIMLDEIVDQGNLGGILRSAYFLGADAVVLSSVSAPLNTVALKAASGAAEAVKLLAVHNTGGFLEASKENGWKVYASVAPPSGKSAHRSKHIELDKLSRPLQDYPCILLLGGEGEGIRPDLIAKADQTISIVGQRNHQGGVDSLNVSVAAGILMESFLREPKTSALATIQGVNSEQSSDTNVLF